MDSNEGGMRVVAPWMRNLEKLGITLRFRSVDFALYQQRLQKFDFDITSLATRARTTQARNWPTCSAARRPATEDSGNFPGAKRCRSMPSSPAW